MEVKAGYKQTEFGVIPKDWDVEFLGELSTVCSGGTPSRTNPRFWNGNIPWVTTTEVDFCTIKKSAQFITKDGLSNSAAKLLPPGTLLMALYGQGKTRGKVGLLGFTAATNQACAAILLKPFVYREFVFHFLVNQYKEIRNLSNNGNQENLNSSIVRSIPILVPSLPEQQAIANALSDADALIESLEKLIEKKRQIKQGVMQELLTGKRRLPGFSGEWERKKVLELGEVVTGGTPRSDVTAFWGHGFPWITPTDISGDRDMYTSERTITWEGLNSIRALPPDTVLVTCIASIGKNAILRTAGACNQQINALKPNKDNSCDFLYYLFGASRQYLQANAGTTATSIISKSAFSELIFNIPQLTEQVAIAEILTEIDSDLAKYNLRWQKSCALKQAMMQNLLTGKVRLV